MCTGHQLTKTKRNKKVVTFTSLLLFVLPLLPTPVKKHHRQKTKGAPNPQRRKMSKEIKREKKGYKPDFYLDRFSCRKSYTYRRHSKHSAQVVPSAVGRHPAQHNLFYGRGGRPRSVYHVDLASLQSIQRRSTPIVVHPAGGWGYLRLARMDTIEVEPAVFTAGEREREKGRKTERARGTDKAVHAEKPAAHAKRKGGGPS